MPDLARPGTGLRREAGCAWETQELTDEHVTVRLVVLPPDGAKLPAAWMRIQNCFILFFPIFLMIKTLIDWKETSFMEYLGCYVDFGKFINVNLLGLFSGMEMDTGM